MTQGIPMSPGKRAALVADMRATIGTSEGSARLLAQRHGVSKSTVSRTAMQEGISFGQVGRSRVENAIQEHRLTAAERRARLADRFLDNVEQALDDMNTEALIFNFGGKDNTYEARTLPRPPTADLRNLATIAAIFTDKHKMLDQYDSDARSGAMLDRWLNAMIGEDQSDGDNG